ncbi:MAG: MFS transporter [Patescibacteria group bacterium]
MRINHVIKTLITSDFLINSGFASFGPIFAIFITQQIDGGSVQVVGFGTAIAQLCKVLFQIPVARYLDKNHGEYDDFISMVLGTALVSAIPFLYLFASLPLHIYLIQGLFGLGLALTVPPWYAIFTRHIDRGQENVEWSLESVAVGISGACAAALGGLLATHFGFQSVFFVAGLFTMAGMGVQLLIYNDLRRKVPRGVVKPNPDRIG